MWLSANGAASVELIEAIGSAHIPRNSVFARKEQKIYWNYWEGWPKKCPSGF
jgi:hypothetical protein